MFQSQDRTLVPVADSREETLEGNTDVFLYLGAQGEKALLASLPPFA